MRKAAVKILITLSIMVLCLTGCKMQPNEKDSNNEHCAFLSIKGDFDTENLPERTKIEEWVIVKSWNDVTLISTWNILWNVIRASEILEEKWIPVQILSIPLIKPMNNSFILNHIKWNKWVFTIEEHTIIWWLWDSIASIVAENWIHTKFKKLWIPDIFPEIVWNQDYMRWYVWLDWEGIANTVLHTLQD